LVRLSLPRPAHPRVFQHSWVRPSSGCYPTFILAGRRSRGFASAAPDLTPRLRLGFPSAPRQSRLASPVTASRRIIMQKARDHPFPVRGIGLSPLVGVWFQVQCPPLVGVLPIVRSRYSVLSVAGEYLALGDGPPRFPPTSTCWAVLRIPLGPRPCPLRGSHPLRPAIPRRSSKASGPNCGPTTPGGRVPPVWAGPRSLAATCGVAVAFFSSGY
jgi:hypothetical protein